MPKKGGKGGKKGGKSKTAWHPAPTSDEVLYERVDPDSAMIVQVSPVTWPFLGFTKRVPATTCIFDIRTQIIAQHGGSIVNVTMYKDEIAPRNELTDLAAPLSSIDFVPLRAGDDVQETVVHICYDFPPHDSDCPLLLNPPHDLKIEARAAAAAAERLPRGQRAAAAAAAATPLAPSPLARQASSLTRNNSTPGGKNSTRLGSYLDRGRIGT